MLPLLLGLACTPASVHYVSPADYAGARLVLGDSLVVDLGTVPSGGHAETRVQVGNDGDLPLGISEIHLASGDPDGRGDKGAFSWRWEEEDRGSGLEGVEAMSRVILPGEEATMLVGFQPVRDGINADALVLRTAAAGDDPDPERRAHDDWLQPRGLVWLEGRGETQHLGIPVMPTRVDLGFAFTDHEAASAWVPLDNVGTGPMDVEEVRFGQDCAPGFSIHEAPEAGATVARGDRTAIRVEYVAPHEGSVKCVLEAVVDGTVVTSQLGANQEWGCPTDDPPEVEILVPESAVAVEAGLPVRVWLRASDHEQPEDTLWCSVRSVLLESELWNCEPSDGPVAVDVPTGSYRAPGVDVLYVVVSDACGRGARASVPLLVDIAWPEDDEDGDGFGADDCDDSDPTAYPWATERPNGVDDDCDGRVDEDTFLTDDDGDGLSEEEGDCDDNDADAWPGAPELPNGSDDDCDGVVDEGTFVFDDDGDRWTEEQEDCDDDDPDVHPGAREICNNATDDDCDLVVDEDDCIDLSNPPWIVGQTWLSQGKVEAGQHVEAIIRVIGDEGDDIEVGWEAYDGAVEPLSLWRAAWIPPAEPGRHRLRVEINGFEDWDFEYVTVVREGGLVRGQEPIPPACDHRAAAPIAWLIALAAAGARRRRRS